MPERSDDDGQGAINAAKRFAASVDGSAVNEECRLAASDALLHAVKAIQRRDSWRGKRIADWGENMFVHEFLGKTDVTRRDVARLQSTARAFLPRYIAPYFKPDSKYLWLVPESMRDEVTDKATDRIDSYLKYYDTPWGLRSFVKQSAYMAEIDTFRHQVVVRDSEERIIEAVARAAAIAEEDCRRDRIIDLIKREADLHDSAFDAAINSVKKYGVSSTHLKWFLWRYEQGMSNLAIAAIEGGPNRRGGLLSTTTAVQRIATAITSVRELFCREYARHLGARLSQIIVNFPAHYSEAMDFHVDLIKGVLMHLTPPDIGIKPLRGRPKGSAKRAADPRADQPMQGE